MVKVLIADDYALFRDAMALLIGQLDEEANVVQVSTFAQLLKVLESDDKPDLIVVDLDIQQAAWERSFDLVRQKASGARILIVSASENPRAVRAVLGKGACGCINKRTETKILTNALKLILDGGIYIPPAALTRELDEKYLRPGDLNSVLTKRQLQVLSMAAKGMSNKQIAYELDLSESTIKLHINSMMKVLGVLNRTQAVIAALRMGLI